MLTLGRQLLKEVENKIIHHCEYFKIGKYLPT